MSTFNANVCRECLVNGARASAGLVTGRLSQRADVFQTEEAAVTAAEGRAVDSLECVTEQ